MLAHGIQVKKMAEHDNFVNSCSVLRRGPPLIVSGSDDGTAKASAACLASQAPRAPAVASQEFVGAHTPEHEPTAST